MVVDVELFGQLGPDLPRRQQVDIPEGIHVSEVARLLGLEMNLIGLITINGLQCEEQDQVPPDSRICFFTHMSGG